MKSEPSAVAHWPAIPAALAIVLCLAITAFVVLAGEEPDHATLQVKAESATAAGQHSAAVLHYQHLLALEPDQPRHALDLALALDQLQRRPEAMAVLSTVAPLAGGGYGPAHLKLAEWTVESRVMGGVVNADAITVAVQHAQAAKADPLLRVQADTLIDILQGMRAP